MGIKHATLLAAILAGSLAPAADDSGVTYTITADEALQGPKPANPNYVIDASVREASIAVDAGKVRGRVHRTVLRAWQAGRFEVKWSTGETRNVDVPTIPAPVSAAGPWELSFPPGWGAPEHVTLPKLMIITERE